MVYSIPEDNGYGDDQSGHQSPPRPLNNLITQKIDNPYVENIYEANVFDNAYTETFALPNPKPPQIELD